MNVILTDLPSPVGSSGSGSETYIGAHVAGAGFAETLMQSAQLDRLIVYAPAGRRRRVASRLAGYASSDKAQVMDDADIREALGPNDQVVVQNLSPHLWRGTHLRWLCGSRPWPVIGITYSLSDPRVYQELMLSLIGGLQPYDAVVCVTECARGVVQRMLASIRRTIQDASLPRLSVIPLGVDTRRFRPSPQEQARNTLRLPKDATVVLYLGRLSSCCKADLFPLLQAFANVGEISRRLLVIAGGTTVGESAIVPLKFRCAELGLTALVRWFLNVPPERRQVLLSAADIFVSPVDSVQETFGLTLVEAMACGLPVIAADWDGYREIVDAPRTGILVPTLLAGDLLRISRVAPLEDDAWVHWELGQAAALDVEHLTDALVRLMRDPDLRKKMGAKARQRVCELFDWSSVICAFQDEWARLSFSARNSNSCPPPSPYWYDYGDVFSGHASARLRLDSVVRRVTWADASASPVTCPPPFLSREMLTDTLRSLEVPTMICSLPGRPATLLQHVAYLVKHGLVKEVS